MRQLDLLELREVCEILGISTLCVDRTEHHSTAMVRRWQSDFANQA
jgi:hypothetical protein